MLSRSWLSLLLPLTLASLIQGCGLFLDVDPPQARDATTGIDGGPSDGALPDGSRPDGASPDAGPCVDGEACDTGNPCELGIIECRAGARVCVPSGPAPASKECRPAVGDCDVAELCDGTSLDCPEDDFAGSDRICRTAVDACDVEERCVGDDVDCPRDGFADFGTACPVGFCDGMGACSDTCTPGAPCSTGNPCVLGTITCDGGTAGCEGTGMPSGRTDVCRPARGACDVAETCVPTSTDCPDDQVAPAGTTCRMGAACDVTEVCDGSSDSCPPDELETAGTVCNPAAGPCDLDELCTGMGRTCPTDVLRPSTHVCRAPTGPCSAPATCAGAPSCPPNGNLPSGTTCTLPDGRTGRCDAAGACEPLTLCTPGAPCDLGCATGTISCGVGSTSTCVPMTFLAAGSRCRPSTGVCDPAETCDGSNPLCPPDTILPDGSPCGSCGVWACAAGSCEPTTPMPAQGRCPPGEFCCGPAGCDTLACF